MNEIRETLKNNLITYSKVRGISQKDLSVALGVSQAAVSHWFKGDNSPNIEVVAKIADLFSVSIAQLLTDPEDEKSPAPSEDNAGNITIEESNRLLVALGYIKPGQELSDRDLEFLGGIIQLLDSWFNKSE